MAEPQYFPRLHRQVRWAFLIVGVLILGALILDLIF